MATVRIDIRHQPGESLRQVLADRDPHRRQRDLVRASLLARPAGSAPTHRRWAIAG
jgi:hypothetical protein